MYTFYYYLLLKVFFSPDIGFTFNLILWQMYKPLSAVKNVSNVRNFPPEIKVYFSFSDSFTNDGPDHFSFKFQGKKTYVFLITRVYLYAFTRIFDTVAFLLCAFSQSVRFQLT